MTDISPEARQPIRSFDQMVEVETPEQVAFSYSVAGVGTRAAAALLDYLICLVPGTLLAFAVTPLLRVDREGQPQSEVGTWIYAVIVLAQFVMLWGYYVFCEGYFDGQTIGKRRMGLRVVQDGGYSVSFAASAVRNIVRIFDMQPGILYLVGIISIAVTKSGKRLGDLIAGTMVIEERVVHLVAQGREGVPGASALAAAQLDEDEFAVLERFVARRGALDPARRKALSDQLVTRFESRFDPEPGPPLARLLRLHERERAARTRGAAVRSDTGARREQHALVAAGTVRWRTFAERLAYARRRGLERMSEEEVSRLVADYRELSTDLARLQTATRGRQSDALFYLSRLVAGGHNLLYRGRRVAATSVWRYITASIPREIRRSWAPVAIAALALFGPAAVAYTVLYREPALAREVLPAGMIDRVETARLRAEQQKGYVDIPEVIRPVAASRIIANNVQVTYFAFAAGVTAGIGTILLLLFNGVALGGFAGFYASTGEGAQLLGFVAPHGVLELSAIVIGGAAGLHIAAGMLLPGVLTRREALVARGRRAITLVAGATLLLIVAGTIEGLISPRVWPLEWKLWVSAATAVALALYLVLGRRVAVEPEPETFAYNDARALIAR
jgi:uncharacterized membrane protein SpoIIM required for sporulation/uncharacterized RDD family membrane protein YckC